MRFRSVFIAVFLGVALIVSAMLFNARRPAVETDQPGADFVRATGKCAACHRHETSAVVHQYERSRHSARGVTCLDCHQALKGQGQIEHYSFPLAQEVTSLNCKQCHVTQYEQYARSRHALPAWGAVLGAEGATPEQVAFAEQYHPGTVDRPPNPLTRLEGAGATESGCLACHSVGKPNSDGSLGSCTHCHGRHNTSLALAREPATCGQCHMGPDHSQIEIYNESKHGVLFNAQRSTINMNADPRRLSTADMPVPTCATCHMSGLEGQKFTHDTTERLSYFLFAAVSEKRPGYQQGQDQMKETCRKCHAGPGVDAFYREAETVLVATNQKVAEAQAIMAALREDGLLTPTPFDEPIEFVAFDYWHYYGRTAKHGAFMGGADFVQWHGNYELLQKLVELKKMAAELRAGHGDR